MRTFVKDYVDLCKDSGKFYKKHWKGTILLNAAIVAGEFAWFYKDQIKEIVKEKFHKDEESQA